MKHMGNFNRGRSGGGRGFERRGFNDRGSRGPAQMHQAVCDNCRKDCEVPFRPTSGKPIYCKNCFESNRGSDSRPANFDMRPMFEAICDECKNSCKVPFQPSGGKPIYCSNCFGEKKGAGSRENGQSQPQHKEQFEALESKLDRILQLLDQKPQEQVVAAKVEPKVVKKRSSKKI